MKIIEFRFLSKNDESNLSDYNDGSAWSRLYEYHLIEEFMKNNLDNNSTVHNSAWGFEGVHITFRNKIDKLYNCLHSDVVNNKYNLETYKYNLLTEDKNLEEKFDCVLNISVLEHLPGGFEGCKKALLNLYKQVKKGGYLICSFDYPRVKLQELESMLGVKCEDVKDRLDGNNSLLVNKNYKHLNIVLLIVQKQ